MDEREKYLVARDRSDIQWVLSTEQGRRAVWRLLGMCGIYRDIEGAGDAAFKQIGRRQVGLELLNIVSDASEELLFVMMKEARNMTIEEKSYDNRINTTTELYNIAGIGDQGQLPDYAEGGPAF